MTDRSPVVAARLDRALTDHGFEPEVSPAYDVVTVRLDLTDAHRLTELLKETDADR